MKNTVGASTLLTSASTTASLDRVTGSRRRTAADECGQLVRRHGFFQQRQRSAALLEVAAKYPSFPIVLEAVRECLQDVYDLPALVALMRAVETEARRRRRTLLLLDTVQDGAGERLYRRLGWREIGAVPNHFVDPFGNPQTSVYFMLALD